MMSLAAPPRKTLRDVMRAALADRAEALPAARTRDRKAALLARFSAIDAEFSTSEQTLAGIAAGRREGWRGRVWAALQISIGIGGAPSRFFPALPEFFRLMQDAWRFELRDQGVTRSAKGGLQAATADGRVAVLIDDAGPEPRILVMIRDVMPDEPIPVLLVIGQGPAIEIDPEWIAAGGTFRLRYEALVEPGLYAIALGNPRGDDDG
ncbi:MAG TPA: hypothetical protein PLI12_03970 [Acetobacteraceae bacterium]|nr:hypothetical protein [Acetobacteraceae bacterium]